MSFWEDSSPIVKGAIIVGVIGLIYLGVAWGMGLFPFPAKCSHEANGATVSGCPENSTCVDGECVQQSRGVSLQ
ncbi:MAG: hypothetical protein KF729_15095 [Sandaracinaceae bacterium]|nr:hypothetical protein [Sandaracinaceae bacterium]